MKNKSISIVKFGILLLPFFLINIGEVKAQQDPNYTQYMLNTMVINPAYVGSRGVVSVGGLYRSQWMGLEGAPKTQTFNVETPVGENMGLGFSIVNDNIGDGTVQETYFDVAFSYTIKVNDESNLAFGINAGGDLLNIDFTNLINYGIEPNLTNIDNKFSPNFGVGAYYYTEKFYAGISVPSLLETEHFENSDDSSSSFLATERMNFYFTSGYIFELDRKTKLRPSVLVKAVSGAPVQVDLSANFLFNEKFTAGAAYRFGSSLSALFGFQITEKLMLGLAYDVATTQLGSTTFNDGSFEVFLRFDFISRYRREVTNKFF
ncbi:PorP/SprF family type IX secretion system membrane protein [Eudoraea chungangensis]|uniref:PorP/SprF family type IX secretion system membrane protein n=1 Tax=Eudoraea chungangensis TaxID=1481905 RepID=UPI0023EA9FB6|nr:type IX secretion system membrane protein PorP/SprF [Eudoraea chungangensis]